LAIVGVLLGFVGLGARGLVARTAVQEASQTVARTVDRARTEAKRRNETLVVLADAGSNQIEIRRRSAAGALLVAQALPNGTEFFGAAGWNSPAVGFEPPYGALTTPVAEARGLQVRWARDTTIDRTVSVTGMFGKVAIE
jgi:type II secretory pathway pseudopilin PulG